MTNLTLDSDSGPLIVGAGPTGLVMACELIRHGVSPRIIDMDSAPSDKSKALVIQVRTLEIFAQMGIVKEILDLGKEVTTVNIYMEGDQIAKVEFKELESPHPFPIMLPQSETERILLDHLKSRGVEVERNIELNTFTQDEAGVFAHLLHSQGKEEDVRVPWLLGCDGAHSNVRKELHLSFPGAPYPEVFVLGDVQIDWELAENELFILLKKNGIFVIFPMPGDKRYRLLALRGPEDPDPDREVSVEEFQELLNEYSPVPGKVQESHWLAKFHLHRRQVPSYQKGRVFVSGDAAHIHSPVGGQGMNTGIQDAFNLAWKLSLVQKGLAPEELLTSYSAERHPVGATMLQTTDRMFSAMVSPNPLIQFFRNHIFPHVASKVSQLAGKKLAEFISEIQVNYKESVIVAEAAPREGAKLENGPQAGERAPPGTLAPVSGGEPIPLFDLFKKTRHCLLLFGGQAGEEPDELSWESWQAWAGGKWKDLLAPVFIWSENLGEKFAALEGEHYLDPDFKLHKTYGVLEGGIYLIRPDGYIGFRQGGGDPVDLETFLNQHYFLD